MQRPVKDGNVGPLFKKQGESFPFFQSLCLCLFFCACRSPSPPPLSVSPLSLSISVCLSVSVSLCRSPGHGVHYLLLNVRPPQAWEELQDKHRPSQAPGASPDSSVLWTHVPICTPSHTSAQVPNTAKVAVALGGGGQVAGGMPSGEPRLQPCTCFIFKTQIQQYNY